MNKYEKIKIIESVICAHFKITEKVLHTKSRFHKYTEPRQICFYFFRKYTAATQREIAKLFNLRCHASVLYAVCTVRKRASVDRTYRENLFVLEKEINFFLNLD